MLKTSVLGRIISAGHAESSNVMVRRNIYTWILRLEIWRNTSGAWM